MYSHFFLLIKLAEAFLNQLHSIAEIEKTFPHFCFLDRVAKVSSQEFKCPITGHIKEHNAAESGDILDVALVSGLHADFSEALLFLVKVDSELQEEQSLSFALHHSYPCRLQNASLHYQFHKAIHDY
jgi:hypothetical protein